MRGSTKGSKHSPELLAANRASKHFPALFAPLVQQTEPKVAGCQQGKQALSRTCLLPWCSKQSPKLLAANRAVNKHFPAPA